MTLDKAFRNLISNEVWEKMPADFRKKNKQYKSKYKLKYRISDAVKRKILLQAGYTNAPENWIPPIDILRKEAAKALDKITAEINGGRTLTSRLEMCAICGNHLIYHDKPCIPV